MAPAAPDVQPCRKVESRQRRRHDSRSRPRRTFASSDRTFPRVGLEVEDAALVAVNRPTVVRPPSASQAEDLHRGVVPEPRLVPQPGRVSPKRHRDRWSGTETAPTPHTQSSEFLADSSVVLISFFSSVPTLDGGGRQTQPDSCLNRDDLAHHDSPDRHDVHLCGDFPLPKLRPRGREQSVRLPGRPSAIHRGPRRWEPVECGRGRGGRRRDG